MNLALHASAVGTSGSACLLAADRLSHQRQQLSKSGVIQMLQIRCDSPRALDCGAAREKWQRRSPGLAALQLTI